MIIDMGGKFEANQPNNIMVYDIDSQSDLNNVGEI
jgi:hypothetical protein